MVSPPTAGRSTARRTAPQVGTSRQLVSLWNPRQNSLFWAARRSFSSFVAAMRCRPGAPSIGFAAAYGWRVDGAELLREGDLLIAVDVLIAEEDDLVLEQGGLDLVAELASRGASEGRSPRSPRRWSAGGAGSSGTRTSIARHASPLRSSGSSWCADRGQRNERRTTFRRRIFVASVPLFKRVISIVA